MIRDEIRAATLGAAPQFKNKLVCVNGQQIEVRQPSIGDRQEIARKSVEVKAGAAGQEPVYAVNGLEMRLQGIIACCYVPGTNERVFDGTDYDVLRAQPSGSFVDVLGEAVLELMNVESEPDTKNSETTESGNGCSR